MSELSIASCFPFTRVKVVAQNVHAEGALIQVQPDLRWHPLCHDCHAPAAGVHSKGHRRMIRDLSEGLEESPLPFSQVRFLLRAQAIPKMELLKNGGEVLCKKTLPETLCRMLRPTDHNVHAAPHILPTSTARR